MTHPETGSSLVDDVVQKAIAGLERGKERIAKGAEVAKGQFEHTSAQLTRLHQRVKAEVQRLASARERLQVAQARWTTALSDSADAAKLNAAATELAEATADLRVIEARQSELADRESVLQHVTERLGSLDEQWVALPEEMGKAIDLLARNFRELGSHLESAEQSRALGLHVIRAQEEERRRLAREIHDGPTQLLNSVVLRIDVCQRFFESDPERLKQELQQLKELVRLSLQDVRKIIFDLRPMTLDDLGLIPALRTFLKDYQAKTGIETDFAVFGHDKRFDPTHEIAIFRIVQEALTNANKHAGASRVWVKVETAGGKEIKVQVKDDGSGFDPAQVKPGVSGSKFGLVAMRERTELLGGTMEIQSSPEHGTKLNFFFPLSE